MNAEAKTQVQHDRSIFRENEYQAIENLCHNKQDSHSIEIRNSFTYSKECFPKDYKTHCLTMREIHSHSSELVQNGLQLKYYSLFLTITLHWKPCWKCWIVQRFSCDQTWLFLWLRIFCLINMTSSVKIFVKIVDRYLLV